MYFDNPSEAFLELYNEIMDHGEEQNGTMLLRNQLFHINMADEDEVYIDTNIRSTKAEYIDHEVAWYFLQDRSPDLIGRAASIWNNMGKTLNSNYGYQLNREQQLAYITHELANNRYSRRAVATVYDGKEHSQYANDTPCLVDLCFSIRGSLLDLCIHFRSNDLVYGFCNDHPTIMLCFFKPVYIFLKHKTIYPDLSPGRITWFVNNLHVYEKHYNLNDNV